MLAALAPNVTLLIAGRALIGLGVASALMAGLKAIVLWFPGDRVALLVTVTNLGRWPVAWLLIEDSISREALEESMALYRRVVEARPDRHRQPCRGHRQPLH